MAHLAPRASLVFPNDIVRSIFEKYISSLRYWVLFSMVCKQWYSVSKSLLRFHRPPPSSGIKLRAWQKEELVDAAINAGELWYLKFLTHRLKFPADQPSWRQSARTFGKIQTLLQISSYFLLPPFPFRSTPLVDALLHGDNAAARACLSVGDDPNAQADTITWGLGITPLHVACGYDNVEMVEALLDAGARVTATDGVGQCITPLHIAAVRNNPKVLNALKYHVENLAQLPRDAAAYLPSYMGRSRWRMFIMELLVSTPA